jgi:putative PEP-CTERM system TPR-repeat lipoprotein
MAALAAGLAASEAVQADVPPATNAEGASNKTADRLVADARKAISQGNGRIALIDLKNALTADPQNIAARMLLGEVLQGMGDLGAAERELRQARKDGASPSLILPTLFSVMLARGEYELLLNQFPDPGANSNVPGAADTLMARALAFQNLKKPSEATDAIDRSLALRRDARGLLVRARIALLQGQTADARKFVDEAIPKANAPDAMLFKTGLLLALGENQAALDLSNQLLERYPGNLSARFARIEAYMALKQDDKAKPEVDDIVAKYPRAEMGVYYRAFLLARAGHVKEAWSIAQNLTGDFRDSQPRIAIVVAEMADQSGNQETAASILGRMLLKDPVSASARLRLAAIRLKQNNAAEALKVVDPIKEFPDIRIQELLSNIYVRLNRNADALNVLHKVDADGKAGPQVERSIAMLEIQTGNADQGIKDLAKLAAKDPTNVNLAVPLIGALMQAKRYSEALTVADRLAADPKQRARALVYRGGILLAQKNDAAAKEAFDRAIAADPKSLEARFARAQLFANAQKFAEANQDLRAVLAVDFKNLGAFLKLAEIAAQQGQDQNVRTLLGQAIAAAPQSPAPRLGLIRYLMTRRDFKSALPVANDLVRAQPTNDDGLVLLGNVQLALGQKKEAVATYRRLATAAPTAAGPQVLLGGALASSGDRAGAARALEVAVKLAPASADTRAAQIQLLLSQGSNDAAVASARAFQTSNPGTLADLLLAETLDRTKQHDEAVAVLTKSLADKPSNVVLLRLANYALQAKDSSGAADMMSKWLARNPDDLAVRLEYANIFMQNEDSAPAIAQYETILKQSPNNVIALNNLGWLIQTSNPKRALSLLLLAQKLSPNSADVADTLGWVKLQQKDAAGGLDLLDKAHTQKPQDGGITYHLVLALNANGKHESARGLLKALLASKAQFKDRPAAVQLASSWH